MDPVPKGTDYLAQPDDQQDMDIGKNKGTTAGGTPPLVQLIGSFAKNFIIPDTD